MEKQKIVILLSLFWLFIYNTTLKAQELNFRVGCFQIENKEENVFIKIERDSILQTEIINYGGDNTIQSDYFICWIDSLTYTLTPSQNTLLIHKDLPLDAVFTVKIIKQDAFSFFTETMANFSKERIYAKVDICNR